MGPRRRFSFWLDTFDREALDIIAERNGRPVAAEIREAVRDRIVREGRALRRDERPVGPGAVEAAPAVAGRPDEP